MEDTRKVSVGAGLDSEDWSLEENKHGRDEWVRKNESGSAMRIPARKVTLAELERIQDQEDAFFGEEEEEPDEDDNLINDHPQTCHCKQCVPDYENQG